MKKLIIIAAAFISIAFIINSCKKTGGDINPLSSVTNNGIGSYLVLDQFTNLNLNSQEIATSTVSVDVHYYPSGEPVDHIVLFATPGSSLDTNDWHLVKTIPYTSPKTTLTVSGAELATALGVAQSSFSPGNSYTIYTRIFTKSGKHYDVNNTGDNSGSGLISGLAYASVFFFVATVTCPYDPTMVAGTYKVIKDTWEDNTPGDLVQVTVETDGKVNISKVWPGTGTGATPINPILIKVDPATGTATVDPVTFAHYPPSSGNYTAKVTTGSGYVFTCTGTITITADILTDLFGDLGNFNLVLQKQ